MLKLQYSGHLIQTVDSLEKTLMLELLKAGGEGDEGMRTLHGITDSMDKTLSKLQEMVKDRESGMLQSMGSQRVRHDRATEHQQQRIKG